MEPTAKPPAGTLFVSCNPAEGPVTRWGIATRPGSFVYIGAERSSEDPKVINYDPELIVMIPADEAGLYLREYNRALASKALIARSFEQYAKQQAAFEKVLKDQQDAAAKAAKEKADAAAKSKADAKQSPPAS